MNFRSSFQESVLEIAAPEEVGIITPPRVRFLLTQFEMVPSRLENLFGNLLYSYPTSPIYASLLLVLLDRISHVLHLLSALEPMVLNLNVAVVSIILLPPAG